VRQFSASDNQPRGPTIRGREGRGIVGYFGTIKINQIHSTHRSEHCPAKSPNSRDWGRNIPKMLRRVKWATSILKTSIVPLSRPARRRGGSSLRSLGSENPALFGSMRRSPHCFWWSRVGDLRAEARSCDAEPIAGIHHERIDFLARGSRANPQPSRNGSSAEICVSSGDSSMKTARQWLRARKSRVSNSSPHDFHTNICDLRLVPSFGGSLGLYSIFGLDQPFLQ
jgi:hypothetical protein